VKIKDIQPGFVFEVNFELGGPNNVHDVYLILENRLAGEHVELRWLYLTGPDAGMTFRTYLAPHSDWGDWRIL